MQIGIWQKPQLSNDSSNNPGSDLQLSLSTALGLPSNMQDRRYFDHYCHRSALQFSSLLDTDFWSQHIPRICASRPAVRHAVLALSAQHEVYLTTRYDANGCNSDHASSLNLAYPLKHYSKAIENLNDRISHAPGNAGVIEETLIICLLFICFEVLHGHDAAALVHLDSGLQIFSNMYSSIQRTCAELEDNTTSIAVIANIFARLDVQATCYVGSRNIQSSSIPTTKYLSQPSFTDFAENPTAAFATLAKARDTLYMHIAHIYHFLRSPPSALKHSRRVRTDESTTKTTKIPFQNGQFCTSEYVNIVTIQQSHLQTLRTWALTFQGLLEQTSSSISSIGRGKPVNDGHAEECAVIWLSYLDIFIVLSTSLEPDQSAYDAYLPQFQSIVEKARAVLCPAFRKDTTEAGKRVFTLDVNVIQSLYFTALKCRDHKLRHSAISLLHISGKEGVWDGEIMAKVAEHVVELEEAEGLVYSSAGQSIPVSALSAADRTFAGMEKVEIPEWARVHGTALLHVDRVNRKVWIRCSKRKAVSFIREEVGDKESENFKWEFNEQVCEW